MYISYHEIHILSTLSTPVMWYSNSQYA